MTASETYLECPVCQQTLAREGSTLRCESGHAFDVAREGYVNLLTSQHRRRNIEGDPAEMIAARRRFLEAGHYARLRDALAERTAAVLARMEAGARACVAEIGCGDGYYVGTIAELAAAAYDNVAFLGSDLSKPAVRSAAKRYPDVTVFVADTHRRIYLRSDSVDVLLDVFAPRNAEEFARVLSPTGRALVAIPAEDHLASLREQLGLLGIQEAKERVITEQFEGKLRLVDRTEVRHPLSLTAEAVGDLVAMGPNRWHQGETPAAPEAAETTASFVVMEFELAQ